MYKNMGEGGTLRFMHQDFPPRNLEQGLNATARVSLVGTSWYRTLLRDQKLGGDGRPLLFCTTDIVASERIRSSCPII